MGQIAGLVRATRDDLRRLRSDPSCAASFIEGDAWAPGVRQVRFPGLLGLVLRLLPITIEEVDPDATPPPDARTTRSRPALELDAGWQPLHYLITGTAWEGDEPLAFLAKGGTELVDDEGGFSSVRLLDPAQVRAWSDALAPITHDILAARFDPEQMVEAGIFARSRPTERDAGLQAKDVLGSFDALRQFVSEAAARDDGLVVYLG